jgi:ribosome recycling factor
VNARSAMDKAIKALKKEMTKVRTGRASTSLLDDVKVEYYGVPTPLSQVATLSAPEARLITVQPWEKIFCRLSKRPCSRRISV